MSKTIQFSVLSRDPNLKATFEFIQQHDLAHEVHLNRVRFWVPLGPVLTEFYLRFETFHVVSPEEDLATGRINTQ
jgi:hypothetical protein